MNWYFFKVYASLAHSIHQNERYLSQLDIRARRFRAARAWDNSKIASSMKLKRLRVGQNVKILNPLLKRYSRNKNKKSQLNRTVNATVVEVNRNGMVTQRLHIFVCALMNSIFWSRIYFYF